MCDAPGFAKARTYIASGNVVFESDRSEAEVKATLEAALERYAKKPVGVMVRTAAEMVAMAQANPFPDAAGARVSAIFLDAAPPEDALDHASGVTVEAMALGVREIYVHYPDGQADTKLKIPAAKAGTARNLNTVAKLAELAAHL
jgi:uncharacterized protein (DUF1697 family)